MNLCARKKIYIIFMTKSVHKRIMLVIVLICLRDDVDFRVSQLYCNVKYSMTDDFQEDILAQFRVPFQDTKVLYENLALIDKPCQYCCM